MKTMVIIIGAAMLCGCNKKELAEIAELTEQKAKLEQDVKQREQESSILFADLQKALTEKSNTIARVAILEGRLRLTEAELAKALTPKEEPIRLPAMAKEGTLVEKVLHSTGKLLAENVTFSRVFAGKVIFRRDGAPPVSFHVSSLHPDLLHSLGIDPVAVRDAEADLAKQWQEANQKAAEALAERQKQERIADAVYYAKQEEAKKQAAADQEKAYARSLQEREISARETEAAADMERTQAYREYLRLRLRGY
jgi:hypothetical protein